MEQKQHSRLRFAIMCNGTQFMRWQAKAIKELISTQDVELVLLIKDVTPKQKVPQSLIRKIGLLGWKFLSKSSNARCRELEIMDLSELLKDIPVIQCKAKQKGRFTQYFDNHDLDQIKKHQPDLILRFAFNVLKGDILNLPKYGVWSFHHGDEERYRGLPAGFWELYNGDTTIGGVLQRLTERLDAGIILKKGIRRSNPTSLSQTRDKIYRESAYWPASVCRDILHDPTKYDQQVASSTQAKVHYNPTNIYVAIFLAKVILRRFKRLIKTLFIVERWHIGIVSKEISEVLNASSRFDEEVKWINLKNSYSYDADPFGAVQNGQLMIHCETYNMLGEKGEIERLIINNGQVKERISAIKEHVHLSYPYLFDEDSNQYCIPEASGEKGVRLYQWNENEKAWGYDRMLIDEIAAGDPTIICYEGKWWLFMTQADDGPNSKLHIWFSEQLNGQWKPHPGNPVKIDVRSSRPAGTPFIHDGKLYRPAQDNSKRYGGRIAINQVEVLNEKCFKETVVAHLECQRGSKFRGGRHTLSKVGNQTLIDGLEDAWAWSSPGLIRVKLKQLFGKD